jgi:TatD DNase family protein
MISDIRGVRLVDSHCHLDFPDFTGQVPAVLERAAANDVAHLVTICTKVTEFDKVLAIAESDPRISCSVGIHPHEAAEEPAVDTDRLVTLAQHVKVVGIGEAGLDYFYDKSPRERQRQVFATHIEAARHSHLPLIVHSRDADDDTIAELEVGAGKGGHDGKPLTGVIHCFTSTQKLADAALAMGFCISLSGIVTFKSAEALRQVAKSVPLDRLLVETDSPYLAPVPKRGKSNEPSYVKHTAAFVAEMLGISYEELAQRTTENFRRLFSKAALR